MLQVVSIKEQIPKLQGIATESIILKEIIDYYLQEKDFFDKSHFLDLLDVYKDTKEYNLIKPNLDKNVLGFLAVLRKSNNTYRLEYFKGNPSPLTLFTYLTNWIPSTLFRNYAYAGPDTTLWKLKKYKVIFVWSLKEDFVVVDLEKFLNKELKDHQKFERFSLYKINTATKTKLTVATSWVFYKPKRVEKSSRVVGLQTV